MTETNRHTHTHTHHCIIIIIDASVVLTAPHVVQPAYSDCMWVGGWVEEDVWKEERKEAE